MFQRSGRHITDGVTALDEEFPEGIRIIDSAGKTAANSDNGDTILMTLGEPPGEPEAQRVDPDRESQYPRWQPVRSGSPP